MTYLPSDVINANYHYYSNGTYFTIKTNNNCYSQYNTQYCDCFYIYPQQDYLRSELFSCSGSNNQEISYSKFSDAVSYRLDIGWIIVITFIILFGMVFLLKSLSSMLFKGVFKS